VYPASQPGGGNPEFRRQLRFLSETIHGLDFLHMQPQNSVVRGQWPPGVTARALVKPGAQYLLYLRTALGGEKKPEFKRAFAANELALELDLPAGEYAAQWLHPASTTKSRAERIAHGGGWLKVQIPAFQDDLALEIRRQ
jgi:hypothetical protein